MKPELSGADENWIRWHAQHNPVIKFIRNKNAISFQPGDILVKEELYGEEWKVVPVSAQSKVAKKYVFMYEDEYGVGYVKQLKADGGDYVHNIVCLASIDHDRIRFQVDPEYATHILINGEGTYDASVEYKLVKERRETVRAENLKLARNKSRGQDVDGTFATFKVGDKFWVANDLNGADSEELEVISKQTTPGIYGGKVTGLMIKDSKGSKRLLTHERFHGFVFKSKPLKLEDML
jgi:hypothetical protein